MDIINNHGKIINEGINDGPLANALQDHMREYYREYYMAEDVKVCKHVKLVKIVNMGMDKDELIYHCDACDTYLVTTLKPFEIEVVEHPSGMVQQNQEKAQ